MRSAAMRNIVFERPHFETHFLGNTAKAETHRICHENSEDALTWNVFARLARARALANVLSTLSTVFVGREPELYLWGLRVRPDDASAPSQFGPLARARQVFEAGIKRFRTEPDIMLYVPRHVLVLIEAKFTSGNTIATVDESEDIGGEKPKSRAGILRRYSARSLPAGALLQPAPSAPFYSQLYRNLVSAISMAHELDVRWGLVNLVCEGQLRRQEPKDAFGDPTTFIRGCLPEASHNQFLYYSWERLYADHVAKRPDLMDLAAYMDNKSASCEKALAL